MFNVGDRVRVKETPECYFTRGMGCRDLDASYDKGCYNMTGVVIQIYDKGDWNVQVKLDQRKYKKEPYICVYRSSFLEHITYKELI